MTRTCSVRSLGSALYVAACGLLGFALGALLRHTAGAITTAIGIVFVLPIVANFLPGTWGENVGKVLNAGGAISNTRHVEGQFDPWTGYSCSPCGGSSCSRWPPS